MWPRFGLKNSLKVAAFKAEINSSTATIVTVGTCTLTANQAGNANYNAAPEVTATVHITQGTQTISVFYPNSSLAAGATVQLTATGGGSPNLVTFTSGSTSICTVGASTAGANSTSVASLSVLAAGDCLLTANQAGDALYLAAAPVSLTLTIGAGSQIFYVHTDHLGTPRAITQASGNGKVWEWKNDDPFGANMPDENPSGIAGTFKYNLRFPGQYYDQETGTYYNYFRDYDPSVGRYVQSDPIGLRGGLNTYGYVGADPMTRIDSLGLSWFDAITNFLFNPADWAGFLSRSDRASREYAQLDGTSLQQLRGISQDLSLISSLPAAFVSGPAGPLSRGVSAQCLVNSGGKGGVLDGAAFAQKDFSNAFSRGGLFAGRTIDDVAASLRSGAMKPADVPIEYIVRDGNTLILNTRSAQALQQAGIPRSAWNAIDMTGNAAAQARLTNQLQGNGLTSQGVLNPTPR
ncbi:MAG: RHS repeat-associated core domain-containing protein [Burkholderiales bacterium]